MNAQETEETVFPFAFTRKKEKKAGEGKQMAASDQEITEGNVESMFLFSHPLHPLFFQ